MKILLDTFVWGGAVTELRVPGMTLFGPVTGHKTQGTRRFLKLRDRKGESSSL
jgi:hypothetical protein